MINTAKEIFNIEIEALNLVKESLGEKFIEILNLITKCDGKVIVTGMGKSGHIARKIAATMSSLGTPSFFLHPAEALHGDLGMISNGDIVFAISYSGESEEITKIIPNIKLIGAKVISITGNADSTLAKYSDVVQVLPKFNEACLLGLAPTSSTTAVLVYGDTLAIMASKIYGFNEKNYGLYHPEGTLGKKLLIKVKDIMITDEENSRIPQDAFLTDAIIELGKKGLGIVNIIDDQNKIIGVFTDGDLRRQLEKGVNIYELNINQIISKSPTLIEDEMLAIEALQILKEKNISSAPVINHNNSLVGTIKLQTILNKGII